MANLEVSLIYMAEAGVWDATALRDGTVEYDTGGIGPTSPEAALSVLATTLYEALAKAEDRLETAIDQLEQLDKEVNRLTEMVRDAN